MLGKIKIIEELDLLNSFKTLAEAYEEISVWRMQKARYSVLKTRDFMADLAVIFHEIRLSYKDQIDKLLKTQKTPTGNTSTTPKNNKQVAVLISPSAKLYGDIVRKTFNLFVEETKNTETDLIIVGKQGKALYDSLPNKKNYTYIDLPEEQITMVNLISVIIQAFTYQKVTLYFGKFVNVINQQPQATDISGTATLPNEAANPQNPQQTSHRKYLFEPTLEEILSFFETQIFLSLFQQTLEESQLARYASRITAMEQTLGNIATSFKGLTFKKRRLQNSLSNSKQLATISGISLWGS